MESTTVSFFYIYPKEKKDFYILCNKNSKIPITSNFFFKQNVKIAVNFSRSIYY